MKKVLLGCIISATFFSCKTSNVASTQSINEGVRSGYNLEKTANTELVLKSVRAMENLDVETYKSYFSADAKFHDNSETTNLEQNASIIGLLKSKGISPKFTSVSPIWEYVYDKNVKPGDPAIHYVVSYQHGELSQGNKKVPLTIIAVDRIKDGKIVEEFLTYDTKGLMELLK